MSADLRESFEEPFSFHIHWVRVNLSKEIRLGKVREGADRDYRHIRRREKKGHCCTLYMLLIPVVRTGPFV